MPTQLLVVKKDSDINWWFTDGVDTPSTPLIGVNQYAGLVEVCFVLAAQGWKYHAVHPSDRNVFFFYR